MEEQPLPATAVSVATGALGPVLQKLTALLGDEQHRSRLGAGTCRDIESIRSMLASLHSLLLRIWERDDLGAECKKWMTEARALSYDMEDDIDDLMIGLERDDDIGHGGLNKFFKNLKMRVEEVSRRCREEWKTTIAPDEEADTNKRSKPSRADPRARFLHEDVWEIVGMTPAFDKLRLLLLSEDHEMVCIHGFAGTGKTTLADMVYQEIGNKFECRAFVSLGKSPDMLEVLGAILTQVTEGVHSVERTSTEATSEEKLIHDISMFLSDKRYLVVVDDIWLWQSWEIIRRALPKGNRHCRIIATTRVNAIAEKCCLTEEGATIYRHSGISRLDAAELSRDIIIGAARAVRRLLILTAEAVSYMVFIERSIGDMCGGMPLAVWCLSNAVVASLEDDIYYDKRKSNLWDMLLGELLSNAQAFAPMVESLRLGYDDLPVHHKTCLLYCTIFPTGYDIERHGLLRKWISQGFFPQGPEQEKEAAAEACLDELVSRGLLQQQEPAASSSYCTVHPMMRAFLLWRSKEANFATCLERPPHDPPPSYTSAPMLFLGFNARTVSAKDLSRARCLALHISDILWDPFPWNQLKRVRVLSIENEGLIQADVDLMAICIQMTHLRYLGLKGTKIHALPVQIGRLQSLETLDVSRTAIEEVPKEIGKLHCMKILDVSNTRVRELPRDIGKLQQLRTLDISNTSVQELPWLSSSSVSVLVGDKAAVKHSEGVLAVIQAWNNHTISPSLLSPGKELSLVLYDHLRRPLPVAGLKVFGSRHMMGVPEWVKQHVANDSSLDIRLCQLNQDDLHFLCNEMPYLQLLTLRLEVLPGKPIVITGAGFLSLKSFCLDCRLPLVTFQQGAMPKLEHLEFKFYNSRALTIEDPVGIRHLPSLKRVVFQCSPRYKSDAPGISAVIHKVREEAKEHRNRISISINGQDEEVIREKKKGTMTSASSDRISERNIVTSNGGAGGSSGASMVLTILPIPYNNGTTDDEKGENIIPVKSYYPFGVTE